MGKKPIPISFSRIPKYLRDKYWILCAIFFLILENYLEMCNDINVRLNLIVLNSILVKQFRNYLASLLLMKLIPNV